MTSAPAAQRGGDTARRIGLVVLITAGAAAALRWYGNRHHFLDLKIYAAAMRWWDDGHPLYSFTIPDRTQGALGFTYPPFAALLLRPLAWLGSTPATVAYLVASVGALVAVTYWLVRPVADRLGVPRWFAVGLAVPLIALLEPVRETVSFGQINLLLVVLIALDLLVLGPRGSAAAGVGIGLATATKLVPGIFIVYLLVCRRWRAAAVAAGTAVAATGLAAAVAPRDSWTFWTSTVLHADGVGNLSYAFNQSLLGMLARLSEPAPPSRWVWLALAVPIAVYGLWRASRAAAAGDEVAGLTLAGFVGSLVSPVTWAHHLFWVVPALVVLVDVGLRPGRRAMLWLALVCYLTITVSLVAIYDYPWQTPPAVSFLLANWYIWVMLFLLPLLPIRTVNGPMWTVPMGPATAEGPADPARPTPPEGRRASGTADATAAAG